MDLTKIRESDLSISRLDHLGLVSGMCQELGLIEYIDAYLPAGADKKLSHGILVQGMLLNGLGYTAQPLHMYPEYMKDKPLDRLIGYSVEADSFNQHAIGRTLDVLYEAGVSELFSGFAHQACKRLGLEVNSIHVDATSFHVDGDCYNASGEESKVIKLTQGYSRDHRPDLNQVVLNLIVENQAGMPLFLKACSGNTVDKKNFADILKDHTKSLKASLQNRYTVGDSALFTPDSLSAIHAAEGYFVTRVPMSLKEAKELQSTGRMDMMELGEGYFAKEIKASYADISQRWLLIFSEKAYQREHETLKKKISKETEQELKDFWHFTKKIFSCEKDAETAYDKFCKHCKFIEIEGMKIIKKGRYAKMGKPLKKSEPERYEYFIEGHCYTSLDKYETALSEKGFFILSTNDFSEAVSAKSILEIYKSQQRVERGFRFLKNPEFLTSAFYLKKPERIEALMMIMTLCLLVYCALEYKIRQSLEKYGAQFKDQKNKDTQKPTARWVFFCFQGVSILTIKDIGQKVINILPRHDVILNVLGPRYLTIYSKTG